MNPRSMNGGDINSRSMSGINSGGGGGGGDVFQNGDNVYTGTNTFNVNLPTSSETPTSGAQLITKAYADATYSTGVNTNDYVTGFSRNALTGAVTITQSDTGTPITSESYTSITDTQINAIGTNTGNITTNASNISTNTGNITTNGTNISNLTTATNPCFKSASLAGQDLTLTPISGTATVISLPSGTGDAVLAGGTSGSRQIFTGFNTFTNDLTMSGAVGIGNRADIDMLGDKGFIKQSATVQNKLLQNGASNEIDQNGTNNIISQSGLNALITTSGKMTCATAPTSGSDLCNKTYVDGAGAGFVSLTAGTAANPQEVTGVCDFKGGSLQMSNPNQTFSMIQPDINTSDVNTLAMTGRRNRINQTGLSNAILNEFTQSGGANTASAISQFTANSLIYQDPTTARFVTNGSIGVGISGFNPSAKLDVTGDTKLRNNGAYIYVYSGNIYISGNATSYTSWGNGGHHIDTYTTSNGVGRRMYINYYANKGVTLTRSNITSDDRIKEDEKFIENATDTLMKLRPQTYIKYAPLIDGSTIKPNFDLSGNFESGLIAQEIYYDCPELKHIVSITDMSNDDIIPSSDDPQKDPDYSDWGNMSAGVDYIQLIPYLIKSNQELNERIIILEAKINNI